MEMLTAQLHSPSEGGTKYTTDKKDQLRVKEEKTITQMLIKKNLSKGIYDFP